MLRMRKSQACTEFGTRSSELRAIISLLQDRIWVWDLSKLDDFLSLGDKVVELPLIDTLVSVDDCLWTFFHFELYFIFSNIGWRVLNSFASIQKRIDWFKSRCFRWELKQVFVRAENIVWAQLGASLFCLDFCINIWVRILLPKSCVLLLKRFLNLNGLLDLESGSLSHGHWTISPLKESIRRREASGLPCVGVFEETDLSNASSVHI